PKTISFDRGPRRIGKADGLRQSVARKIAGQENVDVDAVLGVPQPFAPGEFLQVAAAEVGGLELGQPRARDEQVDVRRDALVAVCPESHRSDDRVRDPGGRQAPGERFSRPVNPARFHEELLRIFSGVLEAALQKPASGHPSMLPREPAWPRGHLRHATLPTAPERPQGASSPTGGAASLRRRQLKEGGWWGGQSPPRPYLHSPSTQTWRPSRRSQWPSRQARPRRSCSQRPGVQT